MLNWTQNESSSLSLSCYFIVIFIFLSLVGFSEKLKIFFPNRFSLPVDVASLLFPVSVSALFSISSCFSQGHFIIFPPPPFFLYRWAAEGFTKRAHSLPPRRRRRRQRAATDASWATSLTAPCSGSLSASPPNSSKQLRLRPASTSPSEQNCLPWGTKGWTVLSWHWERRQKVHSCDERHEGKWSNLSQH